MGAVGCSRSLCRGDAARHRWLPPCRHAHRGQVQDEPEPQRRGSRRRRKRPQKPTSRRRSGDGRGRLASSLAQPLSYCLAPSMGRGGGAVEQQLALARVLRERGRTLELAAGLLEATELVQEIGAYTRQQMIVLERRLVGQRVDKVEA